jgi:putrescine aminotransferase
MERFDSKQGAGTVFRDAAIRNGVCLRASGDTIICAPPFTLTHAEADELIEKAQAALDESLALLRK